MDAARASATAIGTALMRAAHTRLDSPVLVDDPWGDRLIAHEEREAIRAVRGLDDLDAGLRAHPSYGTVIIRARYAEDALAEAVARGVRRYVIVGAGMDSFALRRPPFARELEIFEVDHPATQEFKVRRLADRGVAPPPGLHFIAADLGEVSLDAALASSPFAPERPAFFSWLGVTPYLSREANFATLRAIARCSAGGELVFSYLDQRVLDVAAPGPLGAVRADVASLGEPWVSGFDPERVADDLREAGLELVEDLGPHELGERYCSGRADGLTASPGAHVARALI